MPDIQEILEHAVDVTIPVDVPADLTRGRARVRRERRWIAGGLAAGVLILVPAGLSLLAGGQDPGHSGTDQEVATQDASAPAPTPTPTPTTSDSPTETPPLKGQTQYYDVPPAPAGWHLVGDQPAYVMIARDGTDPSLTGGFQGKLMILQMNEGFALKHGTPVQYHGRTFYRLADEGSDSVSVQTEQGAWLIAQYPPGAFEVPVMLAFLDAVKPLAGAYGAG